MRILVTGGAGFIGSHLCDRMLAEGHSVIAMDNLITGSTDNIAHLAGHRSFLFVEHDVTNYIYVEGHLDAVLHFASPASPVDYLNYPIQTLKVGALGTHKALGLAKAKNARFLLASTSEVYGDPLIHPQPEEYWGNVNPVGPRGVYDEAKRFAEAMTMAYHRYHGLETRIVRIFNTYGPRQSARAVIPTIITQALVRDEIRLGSLTPQRDFTFVADTVDGFMRMASVDAAVGQEVNIGADSTISIGDLAQRILRLVGRDLPIVADDQRKRPAGSEVMRLWADNRKAAALIGWRPRVSLDEGLALTIDWVRQNLARFRPGVYEV
ncbi:MAG: GDP-mannose 4,6-dehydratase [Anaerolineae bacterium]|nr:GDP-mannose 4,6-dehydratase [Anaerolineae bacterium]